jgi:hypothetical protein
LLLPDAPVLNDIDRRRPESARYSSLPERTPSQHRSERRNLCNAALVLQH